MTGNGTKQNGEKMNMKQEFSIDVIKRWMNDYNSDVRAPAMWACVGRTDVPLAVIERGLKDKDCDVRVAAMQACVGRTDVPLAVIERGLKDEDWRVRSAAMNACKGRDDESLIRTFEPPERVYKKCLGDVIVVAEIPKDAQIRGYAGGKGRTNKAKIVDVIGTFGGEKVGISIFDKSKTYFIGDDVEIKDFDFSTEECSTGFHFFSTLVQAIEYRI